MWLRRVRKTADLRIFSQKTATKRWYPAYYVQNSSLFFWLTGHVITAAVLAVLLIAWYGIHERLSIRTFGGITGDLAGFCISISELLCLVVAAVGGLVL